MSNIPSNIPRPKSYVQSTSPTKYNAISSPPARTHLPSSDSRSKIREESQLGWSPLRIQKRADSPVKDNGDGLGDGGPLRSSGGGVAAAAPGVPTGDRRTSSSYKHLKTNSLVSNSPFKSSSGGPLSAVSPQQQHQDTLPTPTRPSPQRKVPIGLGISNNPLHNVPSTLAATINNTKVSPSKKRSGSAGEMRMVVVGHSDENDILDNSDDDDENAPHVEVDHSFNPSQTNKQQRPASSIWNAQETKRRQSAGLVNLPQRTAVSNSPFLRSPSTPSDGSGDVFSDESGMDARMKLMHHQERQEGGITTEEDDSEGGNVFSSPEVDDSAQAHLQEQAHQFDPRDDDEGPTPPPGPTTPPSVLSAYMPDHAPTQQVSYTYKRSVSSSPPPAQHQALQPRSSLKSRRLRGPRHSLERPGAAPSTRPRAKTVTFNEMKDVLEFDRDTSVEYGSEDDALYGGDMDGGMDYYYESDSEDDDGPGEGNSSDLLEMQFEGMGVFDSNELGIEDTGVYHLQQHQPHQYQQQDEDVAEDEDLEEVSLNQQIDQEVDFVQGAGSGDAQVHDISLDELVLGPQQTVYHAFSAHQQPPAIITTSASNQRLAADVEVRQVNNGPHLPRKVSNTDFSQQQQEIEMSAPPATNSDEHLSRPSLITRRSESFGDPFQLEQQASTQQSTHNTSAVSSTSADETFDEGDESILDTSFTLPDVESTSPMFPGVELPALPSVASLPTRPSSYTLTTSSRRKSGGVPFKAPPTLPSIPSSSELTTSPVEPTTVVTRKRGYKVVERPTTYYSSSSQMAEERIIHDGQAGDLDKGGKAWRSVRRASDMNQYAEEIRQIRSNEKPGKQHSKVFVKIVKISDMNIPMPTESTKFSCRLNNGLHCVDTQVYPFGQSAEMGTEFELLGLENLEFTLAIRIRNDPHIISRAQALSVPKTITPSIAPSKAAYTNRFSKVFSSSPKKSKGPATAMSRSATPVAPADALRDDLVRYLSPDGTLGQAKLVYKTIASKCMGEHLTLDLPLSARWNESSVALAKRLGRSGTEMQRTIGRIQLQVMAIPALPGLSQEQMPQSMEDALQGLRNLKWHKMDFHAGELNQMGGDCSSWRRRKYRLIGATLEATSLSTRKVISRIDLTILSSLRDNNTTSTSGNTQMHDDMASTVDRSFAMVFVDGEEIQFYADTDDEKEKWMSLLSQLVGVQIPTLPLWAEMYWVKQQAEEEAKLQLPVEQAPPVPDKI